MSSSATQQQFAMVGGAGSTAVISECGRYRYILTRTWSTKAPAVFVMLNPSKADAIEPDPTVTRCCGFAKAWDCGGIVVVNLFALRSANPKELLKVDDPIGPKTDSYIRAAVLTGSPLICAWGAHKAIRKHARDRAVLDLIRSAGIEPKCLRLGNEGPWHPLYLPGSLRPIPFGGAP